MLQRNMATAVRAKTANHKKNAALQHGGSEAVEDVRWEESGLRGRRARLGITFSGSLPKITLAQ